MMNEEPPPLGLPLSRQPLELEGESPCWAVPFCPLVPPNLYPSSKAFLPDWVIQ